MEFIKDKSRRIAYNNADKLESINFTRFYPEQLIPNGKQYPDDVMLKLMLYGKLSQSNITLSLAEEVSTRWETNKGVSDFILARGLGFYIYFSSKDKIYRFMNELEETFLHKVMKNFTKHLIKKGIADPRQLIIDNTQIGARKDDPDISKKNVKRGSPGLCHKAQILCDLEQTPLMVIRRPGAENDENGFEKMEQTLIYIKNEAEKNGTKIEYVIADAGYFGKKTIDFISDKLGAKSILDINPRKSKNFKEIKKMIESYKLLAAKYRKKKKSRGKRCGMRYKLFREIQKIEHKLKVCKTSGTEIEKYVAEKILNIGVENYLLIYRRRSIVEGLIGCSKEYF
ncbi:MAG: transposase [Candidatus Lokiarchaeota archaeon]|nr:transposase [Candidatus Lokiarchaeota archaeon]